jgi:LysM repeat protein
MQARQRQMVARAAAPIAFFLLATLGIVAVRSALDGSPATPPAASSTPIVQETQTKPATGTKKRNRVKFYRVREGDTLESIASDHGTSVEDLLTLNPGIDPVALRIGQRIRVG